jgi:hypothetical protein
MWSRSGRELFFESLDNRIIARNSRAGASTLSGSFILQF